MQIKDIRSIIVENYALDEVFSTAELIKLNTGKFVSNAGVAPSLSPNARFGKFLSRNESELGIENVAKNVSTRDDNGRSTKTAKWKRVR